MEETGAGKWHLVTEKAHLEVWPKGSPHQKSLGDLLKIQISRPHPQTTDVIAENLNFARASHTLWFEA